MSDRVKELEAEISQLEKRLCDELITQSHAEIGKAVMTLLTVPEYVKELQQSFNCCGWPRRVNHSCFSIEHPPRALQASHARAKSETEALWACLRELLFSAHQNTPAVSASSSDTQQERVKHD